MDYTPPFRTGREYNYDQSPPGFGVEVLVPNTVKERLVWASINTNGGVTLEGIVNAQVETGVGTGVFVNTGVRWRSPSGEQHTSSGTFVVPRGRKYRFVEEESAGTTSFVQYGYRDEVN